MDASLSNQLALAAFVCSVVALGFSLVAAFPGLKVLLATIRDAVLWLALALVLGGVGYVLWQERQVSPAGAPPSRPPLQAAAEREATFPASDLPPGPLRPKTPVSLLVTPDP
jgi:hypothetical protein